MVLRVVSDRSNVLPFPVERIEPPSIELVARLVPTRSLVDTLIAERGDAHHDTHSVFAHEFAYQVRALEIGFGRDQAIIRLRGLVDAHVTHAVEVCRGYQQAMEHLVRKEISVAHRLKVSPQERNALETARAEMRGRAIAARIAADSAQGAASALAIYVLDGLGGLAASDVEPRQLQLFEAVAV
jgi:hypothetical protein